MGREGGGKRGRREERGEGREGGGKRRRREVGGGRREEGEGRNSQVARQDRLTQQKVRFRCVSRYIRPWCAVVFTGGMRERHRTSPAGFESSRVASCGPLAGVAGGRRWRTSLAGVAGGLAGEAHKKTDQFH